MNKIKFFVAFVFFCISATAQTLNETSEKILQFWRENGVDVSENVAKQMDRLNNDGKLKEYKLFDAFDVAVDLTKLFIDFKPDQNGVYPNYTALILEFTTKEITKIPDFLSIDGICINEPWDLASMKILFDIVKSNDQRFVNNQIEFYTQYKAMGEVDPYLDPFNIDRGYLKPPVTNKIFGSWVLPNSELTPEKIKEIVTTTYKRIHETEGDFDNSKKEFAIKSYKLFEKNAETIEDYLNGFYTDIVLNKVNGSNYGLTFYNTGNNVIENLKIIKKNILSSDNVITIGNIDSKNAKVITTAELQDIDAGNFDEVQFDLLGYTLTLDYNTLIKPFVATLKIKISENDLQKGIAPEQVFFEVFINANNINNEPFEITIDYDDNYIENIQTTTHNGLKTLLIPHTYKQSGVFFPSITVKNLNINNIFSSSYEYLKLENPITIKYPITQTSNFYAGTNTSWSSNAVSTTLPDYDIKWDFNYKNATFSIDANPNIDETASWMFSPPSSEFSNANVLQSTIAMVASVNIDNTIYSDTAFQTIKIFNPVISKITFTPKTKNIITDVSLLPYQIKLSGENSVSATGRPLNYKWYVNQADSGGNKVVNYKINRSGKSYIKLYASDGTYSNEITDSITLDFNISYNPDVNLSRLEYFFDLDPGTGNGHSIPINFQNSVLYANTTINCNNLFTGLHRIYFRAKDSAGKWSIPQSQIIIVQAYNPNATQLTEAEYFFDSDPGKGDGIKLPVQVADSISASSIVNLPNVSTGLHRIYFRVKDNLGNWSIPQSQLVIVQAFNPKATQITASEYFFDTDPGEGNGISLSIQSGDSISINTIQNIQNISTGLHRIYFRVNDNLGNWSIPQSQLVIIQNGSSLEKINYAEYFFDSDPGFGKATKFVISSTNDLFINETLNIGSLSQGIHVINLRVRDESGKWSIPISAQFEVIKDISSDTYITRLNNESKYLIYGGKNQFSVVTPNNQNSKYQLKVFDLNGKLIINKQIVGCLKNTIDKGLYVVEIVDDLNNSLISNQKIFVY